MPLPAPSAHCSPFAQALGDRLSLMGELPCPHHFATPLCYQRQTSGVTARVDLQTQWLVNGLLYGLSENQGEREALEDSSLACFEQEPCSPWMYWSKWALLGVHQKHM
jgi:hypothetical protein